MYNKRISTRWNGLGTYRYFLVDLWHIYPETKIQIVHIIIYNNKNNNNKNNVMCTLCDTEFCFVI